jgi:plastocyanin
MKITYKALILISTIALLAAGCNKTGTPNPSNSSSQQNPTSTSQFSPSPANAPGQNIVTYTDSGFSPQTLIIKKGDTVIFENNASDDVRVSSNPHPIHNDYPTTGGCVSSTFDSCGNIAPGQSWSFKFDIAGSWGYHNHLNPVEGGTIVVQGNTASSSSSPATTIPKTPQPSPSPSPIPTPSTNVSIVISNFAFNPTSLTIKKGTKVIWTNQDNTSHTVTGDNGGPASGTLASGNSYSFTFNQTGSFSYHCSIHPFMTASVTVTQ